jgi:cobalamin biosynthesis protein CobW
VHTHHDHHHTHGESHDHAHDHFDSFVITLGEVNSESLQSSLQYLLENNNIYRVKGFLAINDKPMRQVLQAVGERLQVHFDRLWEDEETRATQLVFIGKDLDKVAITQVLEASMLESA